MPRIPTATYRLQLHSEFGLDDAAQIADYLQHLGISHVYCSPYLQAAPGSKHGYDVVDHHKVNEELGGAEAHDRFCKRLGACHLGQVLDIVPNHMAISGRRNRLWWDVLENGPASRYASYFDIEWNASADTPRNKMLVPILGDHYGRVLARGEIEVNRNGGEFVTKYFDNELPAAPRSLPIILSPAASQTGSEYLAFLADSLRKLPAPGETDPTSLVQRHRDKELIRSLLERLFTEVPFIAEAVDSQLKELNRSIDKLNSFLERQNFRLAFWRTAEQDLIYRRFFDVNTLVGLRMEDPQVFADTHALVLRWLREGVLDGIRVDHPDGLRDPRQYFERLRKESPDVWILGEKILEPGEHLRPEWPIDGTTGYDFLNQAAGLFVDPENESEFNRIYTEFTGESTDYPAVCRDKKHRILRDLLGSDVNRLSHLLLEICKSHRDQRDYTRHDVIRALREVIACFSVYRTYVVPERNEIDPEDIRYIEEAIRTAKEHRPELEPALLDFIRDILLIRVPGPLENEFVLRFQQFTGPAMAKGVEDTTFYNYNRLISLNEVGGDPGRFGIPVSEFHELCVEKHETHPRAMLSSSTHDTKRSEDVRARVSLLSEIPREWETVLKRWSGMNAGLKQNDSPDPNTEYLIYQTLIGAWPISEERLLPYLEKACREAKRHTTWLTPNEPFEAGVRAFVAGLYRSTEFQRDLECFVKPLIAPGRINSLSQQLLKLTAPGIPDMYQGTELWDLSLVDPDNRRPVDYQERRRLLAELPKLNPQQIWSRSEDGLLKLWTLFQTLQVRKRRTADFDERGTYQPISAKGERADHLVAYRRGEGVIVLVPRLIMKLGNDWKGASVNLPEGHWRNWLSGGAILREGEHKLQDVLAEFPIGLLVKE